MSKGIQFIKDSLLIDSEGNRSRLIRVRGGESGLDHLELVTQSPCEREMGIATRHRIFSEEVEADHTQPQPEPTIL
jgi:hypothetical protein